MRIKTLYSIALFAGILTGCVADTSTTDDDSSTDAAVAARKTTCTVVESCIIGYSWDSTTCQCVASHSQTCGPSLTCHHTDHCCVPSSAEPNYYCAAATEVCQ
jgi:hypothetical protein